MIVRTPSAIERIIKVCLKEVIIPRLLIAHTPYIGVLTNKGSVVRSLKIIFQKIES